jgi:hydrogenase maturation protease
MSMSQAARGRARVAVIGIGNDLRGDDGIGPHAIRRLRGRVDGRVRLIQNRGDALDLVAAWEGVEALFVIDASLSGEVPPGTVTRIEEGDSVVSKNIARCSTHGFGLAEALELGAALGRSPRRIVVYAAEAESMAHGTELSAVASRACDDIAARVLEEIRTGMADIGG